MKDSTANILSNRALHDHVCRDIERCMPPALRDWGVKQHIDPFLILWTTEAIRTDDGRSLIDGAILQELTDDKSKWPELITRAIKKIVPFGICLTTNVEEGVQVLFESPCGTRAWLFKKKHVGDRWLLQDPEPPVDDVHHLGQLWWPTARS